MNKFFRLICAVLSIITVVAVFPGCSSDKNGGKKVNPNHNFSYEETDRYILRDGVTEYKVVAPKSDVIEMSYAKTELITIFEEATGVTLKSESDEGLVHTKEGKYISLGNTSLYKSSGIDADLSAIKEDGVRIITKDNTVYLLGGSAKGVLYAVYDFLKMNFGFETYYKDCYTLDKNVKNLKLMNYDVTDIPDIDYRGRMQRVKEDRQETPDITTAISYATCSVASDLKAAAIITVTMSGFTANMIARYKPGCQIIGCTLDEKVYRQLNLLWGVNPVMIQKEQTTDALFEEAVFKAKQAGLVKTGDTVVITAGVPLGVVGKTDMIHVVEVE